MSKNKSQDAPLRHLTASEALAELVRIESVIEAVCKTAPVAVAALGGRSAVQKMCRMTSIGPMPEIPEAEWAAMAAEHAFAQHS
jgi:hypothetical protein